MKSLVILSRSFRTGGQRYFVLPSSFKSDRVYSLISYVTSKTQVLCNFSFTQIHPWHASAIHMDSSTSFMWLQNTSSNESYSKELDSLYGHANT